MRLRPYKQPIVDGENNSIAVDAAYVVKGDDDIVALVSQISQLHNGPIGLLPLAGMSGGGGVFQVEPAPELTVIGIVFAPTSQPKIRRSADVDITAIRLDEIIIDESLKTVYAGASITLEQLNLALAQECGDQYKVLGADLTSYTYASVGATFMTGGMGPQRRYFSDSVNQISLFDGDALKVISGDALGGIAGTYGWSGVATAVACNYVELPKNEIAFAIPIANTPQSIAALLAHLLPFAQLELNNTVISSQKGHDLVLGIEHATVASMQPLLVQTGATETTRRVKQLIEKCAAAEADGLMFINGYSDNSMDHFFGCLIDNPESEELTIAGIDLAHTEVFDKPDQMRALREAIPFAARTQQLAGDYDYKGHTDANIQLNPDCAQKAMHALWSLNQQYVDKVQQYFDAAEDIKGEILVYGHLNPVGVDPHNRVTFSCDSPTSFQQAVKSLEEYRNHFYRELNELCERTGSRFIGGEKGAGSEREILEAFTKQAAPKMIVTKFEQQVVAIQNAKPLFNWRAMPPYR